MNACGTKIIEFNLDMHQMNRTDVRTTLTFGLPTYLHTFRTTSMVVFWPYSSASGTFAQFCYCLDCITVCFSLKNFLLFKRAIVTVGDGFLEFSPVAAVTWPRLN